MQGNFNYTSAALNAESTNDALARHEKQINEQRLKREQDQQAEDRGIREGLQKQASAGERRSLVDIMNIGSISDRALDDRIELITKLRSDQQIARRTPQEHNRAYDRFERTQSAGFNRLHPESLRRTMPVPDAAGGTREARLSPVRNERRGSNFEIDGRDPGNVGGSRFEWDEPYVSTLTARKILDAAGKLLSAARTESAGGEVTTPRAEWLLSTANALIAAVNRKEYARGRV